MAGEKQALPVVAQAFLELGKRSAATGGDDELGGFIGHDAGVATRVEDLSLERVAVEILGAAAAQAQRLLPSGCGPDPVLELLDRQKRGSSGCGSLPPCTRMRPYSAQRASVGTALPGLSRPFGSNARFTP